MNTTLDPHTHVLDLIAELTRPHQHREHYTTDPVAGTRWTRDHITRVPPLLTQLEHASPSGEGEDRSSGGYESRPTARLEALDTLVWIDREASAWVRELGWDDPSSTAACVQLLGGLMAGMDRCDHRRPRCCPAHALEGDVRRWWAQARIVAGWDSPAWRPDATCPICAVRGSLRIRLSAKAGLCVDCRETWGPDTIGLLADHIRAESVQVRVLARDPEPCWCPWPTPVEFLGPLCPRCGSARCHRAVHQTMASAS